jgi:deoxyribonuclease V
MLPHLWNLAPKEAIQLQRELAGLVRVEALPGEIRSVAGADCAFIGRDRIVAAAVLCDAGTLNVIATAEVIQPCTFPYVPGLLSFREAPAIIAAIGKLPTRPDLLMIDGQGQAHPRRFGIASHVGLWLDIPTIGVAKSLLCGEHRAPAAARGRRTLIRYNGAVVGAALRTRTGVKPVFISVGHRVTLQEAIRWALRAARFVRLPEPTRRAHQYVTRIVGK